MRKKSGHHISRCRINGIAYLENYLFLLSSLTLFKPHNGINGNGSFEIDKIPLCSNFFSIFWWIFLCCLKIHWEFLLLKNFLKTVIVTFNKAMAWICLLRIISFCKQIHSLILTSLLTVWESFIFDDAPLVKVMSFWIIYK